MDIKITSQDIAEISALIEYMASIHQRLASGERVRLGAKDIPKIKQIAQDLASIKWFIGSLPKDVHES